VHQPRAIIELSASTLVVTAWKPRGEPVSFSHVFAPLDLNERWPGSLTELTAPLASLIAKAGLRGSPATVLYTSPTCESGVFSCPVAAGARKCEQAAQLALADASQLDLGAHPFDITRLAGDRPTPPSENIAPQMAHFLAAADDESSLRALGEWIAGVGLLPDQFVPLETLSLAAAARAALRQADRHGPVAVVYASEHASALAAAGAGKLWFVRTLGVGQADLVQALTRGIRRGVDDADPIRLTFAQARKLLEESGIPEASGVIDVIDTQLGITGAHVLPLLQPVLQRWGVEVKQSLRFGIPKGTREGVKFSLIGPGRRVNRLEEVIVSHLSLQTIPVPPEESHQDKSAWGVWHLLRRSSVCLLPRAAQSHAWAKEVRRTLAAGCVAAAVIVGGNAWFTGREITEAQARVAQLRSEAKSYEPAMLAAQRVALARAGLEAALDQTNKTLGEASPWNDWLAALNNAVPEGVRVASIRLNHEGRQPVCIISGRTEAGSINQTSRLIKTYLDRLAAVPLAQQCRLGRTERIGPSGRTHQTFEVSVQLIALPSTHAGATLASAATDGPP
jgi:Tfp pilus assembly protein PilN